MKKFIPTFILFCTLAVFIHSCSNDASDKVQPTPSLTTSQPTSTIEPAPYTSLMISEVMPSNKASLLDTDGRFSDWIEITNTGDETAELSEYCLSDDPDKIDKFILPQKKLAPNEYLLIFATGESTAAENELYAPFKLSKDGESILLTHKDGTCIDTFSYENAKSDTSILSDGTVTRFITPGFPNTDEGFLEYQKTLIPTSGLIINEVMTANSKYLTTNDKNYDWVELYNNSDTTINLSEYAITDSLDSPSRYVLPQKKLAPHKYYTVLCGDDAENDVLLSGFSLNSEDEHIYLTKSNIVCDFISLGNIPYGSSYGRSPYNSGWRFISSPTPNSANMDGILMIARTPIPSVPQGVYDYTEKITVELNGEGIIYYTTDGSEPNTDSAVYSTPFILSNTTVIRAKSVIDGKIDSPTSTLSYIINENHTLPILSLATAEENLFDPDTGIYVKGNHENYYQDWEKPASLTLFENGNTVFSADCGLCMFGAGSREDCEKKSLRVNFKSKYGTSKIDCNLFSNGVTKYKSLVMRAGEDAPRSIFRNELFTTLAKDTNMLTQSSKYCILYVDGKYFGIFCLCEKFSSYYYSQHYNVPESSVKITESPVSSHSDVGKLMKYSQTHDMTDSECYSYMESHLDLDSMIDWFIFQAYSHNRDILGNLRYFYNSSTGKIQYAFYDLDWACYYRDSRFSILSDGEQYSILMHNMLKNTTFRAKFISRMGELLNGVLSDSNVLETIDYYYELLKPEIERERSVWTENGEASAASWERAVDRLRSYITVSSIKEEMITSLRHEIGLTEAEAKIIRNG